MPPPRQTIGYVNRFSMEILQKVMARILFFCEPFDDCVSYLMSVEELEYYGEIDCGSDPQDRIMVFRPGRY